MIIVLVLGRRAAVIAGRLGRCIRQDLGDRGAVVPPATVLPAPLAADAEPDGEDLDPLAFGAPVTCVEAMRGYMREFVLFANRTEGGLDTGFPGAGTTLTGASPTSTSGAPLAGGDLYLGRRADTVDRRLLASVTWLSAARQVASMPSARRSMSSG